MSDNTHKSNPSDSLTEEISAGLSWREQFDQRKLSQQGLQTDGRTDSGFGSPAQNQFQKNTPSTTSRKAKKGFRAG